MNSLAYCLILCLGHPWLADHIDDLRIPFDMIILKLVRAYISSSSLRKSALGVRTIIWGLIIYRFFFKYLFLIISQN